MNHTSLFQHIEVERNLKKKLTDRSYRIQAVQSQGTQYLHLYIAYFCQGQGKAWWDLAQNQVKTGLRV